MQENGPESRILRTRVSGPSSCMAALGALLLLAWRLTQPAQVSTTPSTVRARHDVIERRTGHLPGAPRSGHMSRERLAAFPRARLLGCSALGNCRMENVCFSAHDGVLIPNTSSTTPPTVREFDRVAGPSSRLTPPYAARIFPRKAFNALTNAFLLEGETFASNCWRQGFRSSNPAHFMAGYGKVFVAALDTHVPRGLSTLIFQSCGHRAQAKWEWGREVWSLIEAKGNESGLLPPAGADVVTLSSTKPLGYRGGNWPQQWPSQGDLVVCARHVTAERNSVATYLGRNHPDIVAEWQRHVQRQLPESSESRTSVPSAVSSEPGIAASPLSDRSSRKTPHAMPSTACASCLNSLRIAIFYREEGSALRRFRNLAGVRAVAARYSAGRVSMVTITSRTNFATQACDATLLYCAGSGCMWMLDSRCAFHWSCTCTILSLIVSDR